jgi:alpha-tubulin suppressor-like RCC1 family protein
MNIFRISKFAVFIVFQAMVFGAQGASEIVAWGGNAAGEATGIPTPQTYFTTGMVMIADQVLSDATAISAGWSHCLALKPDGTVAGWGSPLLGEAAGSTPVPGGQSDGIVRIEGKVLNDVTAISAGRNYSLALVKDGSVVTWGKGRGNNEAPLAAPSDLTNAVYVAAGWNYGVAATSNGEVVCWGGRSVPPGLSNVVAVAAGHEAFSPILALRSDGTVAKWTTGAQEQVPAEATNVVGIAAGAGHSLALRKDGTVVGWGSNQFGEATGTPSEKFPKLGAGEVVIAGQPLRNVIAIAAGHDFSMALKQDGRLIVWGQNGFHQCDVPAGLTNVVAIAAGDHFCLALTNTSGLHSPK